MEVEAKSKQMRFRSTIRTATRFLGQPSRNRSQYQANSGYNRNGSPSLHQGC
jgi:hypothetical protein